MGVEERFEAPIAGSFVRIQGFVDARFADHVREVKTSKVKNTTPRPEWRVQSVIYQALTGLPVRHDQVIPHKGEVVPLNAEPVFDAERVAGLLATRAATTIMTLFEAYGDDEAWPLSGYAHPYACSGCPHRSSCQAWS